MLKSVIFDMDGVLVNSEPLHYQAFVRTLAQWGKCLTYEEYKKYTFTKSDEFYNKNDICYFICSNYDITNYTILF